MNLFGLGEERPKSAEYNKHERKYQDSFDDVSLVSPVSSSEQVFHMRKYTTTKPNVVLRVYDCDKVETSKWCEESKIQHFFNRVLRWKAWKRAAIKSRQSDLVEDSDADENDEEYSSEDDMDSTNNDNYPINEDEEVDIKMDQDGNCRAVSPLFKRVNLSWPYWTHQSTDRLGLTNFTKPLFKQRSSYIDMFFRESHGKFPFDEETMECTIRMNPDTITAQTQGKVSFTNDPYNVIPLSIEVLRERSTLPGIWDKVLVTKGHSPFVPGVQCALSGDIKSLAHNPIIEGDASGDLISTPVMYELQSQYTSNPDIVRLINMDIDRLKNQVEMSINTNVNRRIEVKRNTNLQNDVEFIVLSYFDEIVGCIKDRTDRYPSKIINTDNQSVSVPLIAVLEWLTKKKKLIDREHRLMDIRDIQLLIKPSSQHDLSLSKELIKSKEFNPISTDYMCHIRMHYIPLRTDNPHPTLSILSPAASPISSTSSLTSPISGNSGIGRNSNNAWLFGFSNK
jgi:hypothetical protein